MRNVRRKAVYVALFFAGCANSDQEPDLDSFNTSERTRAAGLALLQVEQFFNSRAASQDDAMQMQATFARYRGLSRAALESMLDMGVPRGEVEDTCTVARVANSEATAKEAEALGSFASAHVELLSVGKLLVRHHEVEHEVNSRSFPEIGGSLTGGSLIGGVVYAQRWPTPPASDTAESMRWRSAGAASLGPIYLELTLPTPPQGLHLTAWQGESMANSSFVTSSSALAPLILRWQPPTDSVQGSYEPVEIALLVAGENIVCTARDDGEFLLPNGASPADEAAVEQAQPCIAVSMTRRQRRPVHVPGMEQASVQMRSTQTACLKMP